MPSSSEEYENDANKIHEAGGVTSHHPQNQQANNTSADSSHGRRASVTERKEDIPIILDFGGGIWINFDKATALDHLLVTYFLAANQMNIDHCDEGNKEHSDGRPYDEDDLANMREGFQKMVVQVREVYQQAGQWEMWLRMHREYVNLARLYGHSEESLLLLFIELREQGKLARFGRREVEAREQAESMETTEA